MKHLHPGRGEGKWEGMGKGFKGARVGGGDESGSARVARGPALGSSRRSQKGSAREKGEGKNK